MDSWTCGRFALKECRYGPRCWKLMCPCSTDQDKIWYGKHVGKNLENVGWSGGAGQLQNEEKFIESFEVQISEVQRQRPWRKSSMALA